MWPTNRRSEAARVGFTLRLKNFGGGFGTGGDLGSILSRNGRGGCTGRRVCGSCHARSDRTAVNGRARRENYTPSKK